MCHSNVNMQIFAALLLLAKLQFELLQRCTVISLKKSNFVAVMHQLERKTECISNK